ncbi:hypothetical protein NKI79_32085 [Mesorhizobium sp. M0340]|uniref:DarT1-associated NADAR antitoxin family protein n=1 Tax=Mesorhizobium sp. M0340 TaxID=2956939 RepID=UPI00333C2E96
MATRPVFIPVRNGAQLFEVRNFEFLWHPGFAESQKRKNVRGLHLAASNAGLGRVLEISTKSEEELGRRLSAFSLKYRLGDKDIPMESLYQGSKVFTKGGPYIDIYDKTPIEAKRDQRIRTSGNIVWFQIEGTVYSSSPTNAFYDWVYIRCLYRHEDFLTRNLSSMDGFSDIEFNPERSINSQARALAILMSLSACGRLKESAEDYELFRSKISRTFSTL